MEVLPSQWELPQVVLGVNIRLADGERESEWGAGWEGLWARPGSAGHDARPHSVNQNSVTHTQLSVRGRRIRGLAVGHQEKGNKESVSVTEGFRRISFLQLYSV